MKVKVTEYKGHLIIETLKPDKDDDFIPVTEPGKIGSVLINTGKHLGISKEALTFMRRLKVSSDDIGEIDAWITEDGRHCFSWLGGLKRTVGPEVTLSNTGFQSIAFLGISNEPAEDAKVAINIALVGVNVKKLTVGCRAKIKSERWDEHNNHEVLLAYRKGKEFGATVLKEGTNVPLIKDTGTVIDQVAWLHPDEIVFVDDNIKDNMSLIDWYDENGENFCPDCGKFCGENATSCPKCGFEW